jgi:hypothetical protein
MTRPTLAILLTLTALTGRAAPPLPRGALESIAAKPFPGGVMDSTERTAFVAVEEGVEAVDLATGIGRWRSHDATWPLVVKGDKLIAVALSRGAITVVELDLTGKGERVFRAEPIDVPGWADASSLRCTWSLEKRTLTLAWQARGTLGRSASGTSEVDLVHARATKVKDVPAAPATVPRLLEKLPVRWHRTIAGQIHAVVEEEAGPMTLLRRQSKLVLRVWSENTGKEARAQELIKGTRPMLLPGLDGLHVWVRDGGTFESASDGAAGAAWHVHSTLDGHRTARVPFVAGTTQATVIGARAYGVASRSGRVLLEGKAGRRHELYAVDLESGKVLWRKPVKECGATPR